MRLSSLLIPLFACFSALADSRVRIAIVDTGFDWKYIDRRPTPNVPHTIREYLCKESFYNLTGLGSGTQDVIGHGTNITGLIAKSLNPKKHCIIIIKYFHFDEWTKTRSENLYLDHKLKTEFFEKQTTKLFDLLDRLKPAYVNMSFGGAYISSEPNRIMRLIDKGTKFTVAAGNEGANMDIYCHYYPACYTIKNPNFSVVGSYFQKSPNGKKYRTSYTNYGKVVTDWELGTDQFGVAYSLTGTSQSTANFTGKRVARENK